MLPRYRTSFATAAAVCLLSALGHAQTMVRVQDAGFKVKSRSLWQNGSDHRSEIFLGGSKSDAGHFGGIGALVIPPVNLYFFTIPGYSLGDTGALFDYSVTAQLGLRFYAGAYGGTVDGNYEANLVYSYPLFVKAGEKVKVTVNYRTTPNAHFDTTTPEYKAGGDLVAQVDATLGGKGAFLGKTLFDRPNLLGESVNRSGQNVLTIGGTTKLIDETALTQSNLPTLLGNVTPLGMSISVPQTATHGIYDNGGLILTGTKYSPFVSFDTTLIGLITAVAGGATDVLDFTSKDININAGDANLALSWKIASFDARQSYGFKQTVRLADAPVLTLFDGGTQLQTHRFAPGAETAVFEFTMPADGRPLNLHPQVTHNAQFDNRIDTGTSGSVGFVPFALGFNGSIGSGAFKQSYAFNATVDDQRIDFGTGTIQNVVQETTSLKPEELSPSAVPDFQINSYDDSNPSPAALWKNGANPALPYAQPPAYNNYTEGSGGIEQFPGYDLSLVPFQSADRTYAFTNAGAAITATVTSWDGQPAAGLGFDVYQKSTNSINLRVPAGLLRPGRHALRLTVTGTFQGVPKTAVYDLPVLVRVPRPVAKTQVWNSLDFGEHSSSFVVNRIYRTTPGGTFFMRVDHALLETEVVLDDNIVLPSTKYVQLGDGNGPTTLTTDANLNYSDKDELRYYTSGSSIVSFTISPELAKSLSGSRHIVRLRTKDVPGTAFVDGAAAAAGDTFVLSALPSSSPDIRDTTLYFWTHAPTIDSIVDGAAKKDATVIGESKDGARLLIHGTEFTPTAVVELQVGSQSFVLPNEFGSDTLLYADVSPKVLLALQQAGHQATVRITTPRFSIPNPTLETPIDTGGMVSKAVTFSPLAPAINTIAPSSPIRSQNVTLKVDGLGFASSGVTAGTTEVSVDGAIIPNSSVRFPEIGRDLTSFEVDVPASLLNRAGTKRLRVVNHATNGYDLIGSYDFTVSNGKPVLNVAAPLTVVADDVNPVTLALTGGLFYNDTTGFADGAAARAKASGLNNLALTLPASKLDQPSVKISLLNPTPGGGQSAEVPVTILEGNAAKLSFTGGLTSYDARTQTYRQIVTMRYDGNRTLRGTIGVDFSNLSSGASVVGTPQLVANDLLKGATTTFIVSFKRTGNAPISWTAKARFL